MLGKNTILKAIHNKLWRLKQTGTVWMLGKNTILKAIHNNIFAIECLANGVNAG